MLSKGGMRTDSGRFREGLLVLGNFRLKILDLGVEPRGLRGQLLDGRPRGSVIILVIIVLPSTKEVIIFQNL